MTYTGHDFSKDNEPTMFTWDTDFNSMKLSIEFVAGS